VSLAIRRVLYVLECELVLQWVAMCAVVYCSVYLSVCFIEFVVPVRVSIAIRGVQHVLECVAVYCSLYLIVCCSELVFQVRVSIALRRVHV